MLFFEQSVDWSGRCETPAGEGDTGDPTGAMAPRRLPDSPRKASTCSGNQQTNLTKPKIKK